MTILASDLVDLLKSEESLAACRERRVQEAARAQGLVSDCETREAAERTRGDRHEATVEKLQAQLAPESRWTLPRVVSAVALGAVGVAGVVLRVTEGGEVWTAVGAGGLVGVLAVSW